MRRLLVLPLLVAVVGCGTPSGPDPSASAEARSPLPTDLPVAPTPVAPSRSAAPSASPVVTIPTTLTSSRWRDGELFLLSGFRDDIRHDENVGYGTDTCRPRRDDLPAGATDGVECSLSAGPAERVGAYLFPTDAAARAAYEARLKEHGLRWEDDGGCPFGSMTPEVDARYQPRAACFVNDAGVANLRIYWPGQSVVIGVLGRTGSIRELATWSSMLPAGQESSDVSDPWLGGIGASTPFPACDVPAVDRVRGAAELTYERADEGGGIWMTDPNLDAPRRLPVQASRSANHLSSWSPDGRQLAYAVTSSRGGEIYLLDPDAGTERHLTRTQPFSSDYPESVAPALSWSPDGRHLAYTEWRAFGDVDPRYRSFVTVVDVASGTKTPLGNGAFIAWAPDARRFLMRVQTGPSLAYPHETRGPIVIHDLASGDRALVGQGATAAWSSDCRSVLLSGGRRDPVLVVVSGLAVRPRLVVDGFEGRWSPVGDALAVATNDGKVWRVSVDSGDAIDLGSGTDPTWADDGSRIAVVATSNGEGLVTVRPDGSERRVVASDQYPLGRLRWSPDGRYIAASHEFMAGETCAGPKFGWVIATDGSGIRMLASPWHAHWRPTDASPREALTTDPPPKRSEGCGG